MTYYNRFDGERMNVIKLNSRSDLSTYFNDDNRQNTKHGNIEYLTAMRYIHRYLQPDMKVLVTGAGSTNYSLELASQGIAVTAVETLQSKLDELNGKITEGMKLVTYKGGIYDLGFLDSDSYDITLVINPMHHLYTEESRKQAVNEAYRVTKPNGLIFISYCLLDGCLSDLCFSRGYINYFLEQELLNTDNFEMLQKPDYLYNMIKKKDADDVINGLSVTRLHFVASDLAPESMYKIIDNMDDKTFELYMLYHFNICEREDMLGSARRCLDIVRKKKPLQLRWVKY